ncbi:MAG: alcohol dehydrogenase catalytic domain-containing protein [Desulfosarcina sp.]|nr:alcohol dehydrogenase catalytic domain-containing protein [Desulfobacterales bacterium]
MKALQFNVNTTRFIAAKALRVFFGQRVFYQGPARTVRLSDIPEPLLPAPDWVKIQTTYCGFCGSDLNLILLHDSPTASPFTSFPCVPGHEIVGSIVETGQDVDAFEVGERVVVNPTLGCRPRGISPVCRICHSGRPVNCENFAEGKLPPGMFIGINSGVNGGFAPYLVAHRSQLSKVPRALSDEAAVMTEPAAVALQTVYDNMPEKGDHCLVIGGGVIGNLVIQVLRALGPDGHIAVIEPAPHAARMAEEAGVDDIIAGKTVFDQTARLTGARIYKPMLGMEIPIGGFNRIYDTVGISATLNLSLRLLTAMGTLSVVGIGGNVKLDLTPLWLKLQTVKGVYAYGHAIHEGESRRVFDLALDLIAGGKIRTDHLVTHKFALADYQKMITTNLNKAAAKAIKTVVAFT